MAAGAPGPTSGHVRGHAGVECDPVAGAVTIPCEYAELGWARQRTPLLRLKGLGREGSGQRAQREGPLQVAEYLLVRTHMWEGEDPSHLGLTSPPGSDP